MKSAQVKTPPKRLTKRSDRKMARSVRDHQWVFMAKVYRLGKVWFCPWNKDHKLDTSNLPENYEVHGLITGMQYLEWFSTHRDWWIIGRWREKKYARSIRLTEAGRKAFDERFKYDEELVTGGLVEPGWCSLPLSRAEFDICRAGPYQPCPNCGSQFAMGLVTMRGFMAVQCMACNFRGPGIPNFRPSAENDRLAFMAWNELPRKQNQNQGA